MGATELELGQLIDGIPGHVIVMTATGDVEFLNAQVLEYFGRSLAELKDWSTSDAVHADDLPRVIDAWMHAVATGEPYEIEFRARRADGVYRWFHTRGRPVRDARGNILRWYLLETDIDDQKRAEECVRTNERSLSHLLETLPGMVWRAKADFEPDYVNQRWKDYSGLTLADVAEQKWEVTKFIHPDDLPMVRQEVSRARTTGMPLDITGRIRRADGTYRWFQTRAEPLRDESGQIICWYGVDVDVDDQKKSELELRATQAKLSRASQLAAGAELAAAIAHELSQPLAALVANGHAGQRWLSGDVPNIGRARRTAERMVRDAHAAAEVVSRIRALFKRTEVARTCLDLNEVVSEVTRLMSHELAAKKVRLEIELATDLPPIWADRVQMQQLIANLVRNGVEAMEPGNGGSRTLSIRSRRQDAGVLIDIADQGSGLDDPERVFEPFFTTKPNGMGMGLAISRSIVEAHRGRLWATPNTPRGAVFSFTLPVAAPDST